VLTFRTGSLTVAVESLAVPSDRWLPAAVGTNWSMFSVAR
jgi:hypothetical protein